MNHNTYHCAFALCFCALMGLPNASAIPVWELLSRQEKMSFLYSLFANEVDQFCETSAWKDCNQELLRYGLSTLKNISEDVLSETDPYQRDANSIIWRTLLQGHALAQSHPSFKVSSSTTRPNSYNDDESFGDLGAASVKLDNVFPVVPSEKYVANNESATSAYTDNATAAIRATDAPIENKEEYGSYTKNRGDFIERVPLTGPVVVKVHLNGTPVDEEVPVHHDEDLLQHQLTQVPLPDFV